MKCYFLHTHSPNIPPPTIPLCIATIHLVMWQETWNDVKDVIKSALKGEDASMNKTINLVNINYDTWSRSAKNKSMALFHSPWVQCTDCYLTVDVFLALGFKFGAFGIPEKFYAQVSENADRERERETHRERQRESTQSTQRPQNTHG